MSDEARYRVSVHESAHALAALFLDRPIREVELIGDGGRCALGLHADSGWCAWRAVDEAIVALVGAMAADRAHLPATIEVPVAARAQEIVTAAADAIWRSPWADSPLDDRTLAERLIAGVSLNDEEAAALLRVAELRAQAMVEDERFQALLSHLADALHREGRLSGDDVRIEVERADSRLRWAAEDANRDGEDDGPTAA